MESKLFNVIKKIDAKRETGKNAEEKAEVSNVDIAEKAVQESSFKRLNVMTPWDAVAFLKSFGQNDIPYLNFVNYILYKGYVVLDPERDDAENVRYSHVVSFCRNSAYSNVMKDFSVLRQMVTSRLFSGDKFDYWSMSREDTILSNYRYDPGKSPCGYCKECSKAANENAPFCPYTYGALLLLTEREYGVSARGMIKEALGDRFINFGPDGCGDGVQLDSALIEGIDSESAAAAALLIQGKHFKVNGRSGDGMINYTFNMLCNEVYSGSCLTPTVDYWMGKRGFTSRLRVDDIRNWTRKKQARCAGCRFRQCPDKLAAYFWYLASLPGTKCSGPAELAFYTSEHTTQFGLSGQNNYQLSRLSDVACDLPMDIAGREDYLNMLKYIASRSLNKARPLIPFSIAIIGDNRDAADELTESYYTAIWYFDYFNNGRNTSKEVLFLSEITPDKLVEKYKEAAVGSVFRWQQIEEYLDRDDFKAVRGRLFKVMEDREKEVFTVISGSPSKLERFFAENPDLCSKIIRHSFRLGSLECESIAVSVFRQLSKNFEMSVEVKEKLQKYIKNDYTRSAIKNSAYVKDFCEKITLNHYINDINADNCLTEKDVPSNKEIKTEEQLFGELDSLVGLDSVKEKIRGIAALAKFNMKTGGRDNSITMHMAFEGNPGTGKTTVARLVAGILNSIGAIPSDKLVECTAKDLIGEYLGQTGPKTARKCEEAYDGVLFIDEAYELDPNPANSFGGNANPYRSECVQELLTQMENNRGRLVVIFAGYTEETEHFIETANPGLSSRVHDRIIFPDYNVDELMTIFLGIAGKKRFRLQSSAQDEIRRIIEEKKLNAKQFDNARFVRNLYEKILIAHARLTADLDEGDPRLMEITLNDVRSIS